MMSGTNWLRTAIAAEQASPTAMQGAAQGGSQVSNAVAGVPSPAGSKGANPSSEQAAKASPSPTPTPTQRVEQGKAQRAEYGQMKQVAVPDAANKALPALNESLHYLTTELAARDDMRLTEPAARGLAIEIMAAWLAESRKGTVSDLASIVVKSPRINAVLDTVQ